MCLINSEEDITFQLYEDAERDLNFDSESRYPSMCCVTSSLKSFCSDDDNDDYEEEEEEMMVGDGDEVEEDASDNEDEPLQQAAGSWVLCINN